MAGLSVIISSFLIHKAQRTYPDDNAKILPTHIDLEDPVHRLIYDNGYPYKQYNLYTSLSIELPKPSEVKQTRQWFERKKHYSDSPKKMFITHFSGPFCPFMQYIDALYA